MKTIHLKVAKVSSHKNDGTPIIERIIIKLDEGINFNKYIKYLHLINFLGNEPPKVIRVLEKIKNNYEECNKKVVQKFQDILNDKLRGVQDKKEIDYKKEYLELKSTNSILMKRLDKLEESLNKDSKPNKIEGIKQK